MHHIVRSRNIDLYISPSGIALPRLPCRQLILALNPWCLVKEAQRSRSERIKAYFQRVAYRNTMKNADVIGFLSGYLHRAYQENACGDESAHARVVYTGVDDRIFETTREVPTLRERNAGRILCVSVYTPHKNVEAVIAVLDVLLRKGVPDIHLVLAGGWADAWYREKIERLIDELNLTDYVSITGFLDREDLEKLYANSQVFCLMSRCESFGIPAVEAQAFGMPVVTSNCCAVPEICGDGGVFFEPDDIAGAAGMIEQLLTEQTLWAQYSERARENVKRFRWERCSGDLLALIDQLEPGPERKRLSCGRSVTDEPRPTTTLE